MTGVILNSAPKSSLSFLPFSMTEVHLRVRTPREETGSLGESSESSPTRLYVDPEHYHEEETSYRMQEMETERERDPLKGGNGEAKSLRGDRL